MMNSTGLCEADYLIVDVCRLGEESMKSILDKAIIEARKGPGRLIQIAYLCPTANYTKYLLSANEAVANNIDVRVELYEVSSEGSILSTLSYLSSKCRPRRIVKYIDIDLGEFEKLAVKAL